MGFKARARKTKADSGKDDKAKAKKNAGETSCAVKSCDKWADKNLGGRSLSFDDATEMWGNGNFSSAKGRVRDCATFSAAELQKLQGLLYLARDESLNKIYEEADDNRKLAAPMED